MPTTKKQTEMHKADQIQYQVINIYPGIHLRFF